MKKKEKKQLAMLDEEDLSQFAIKGSEMDWDKALGGKKLGIISVKRSELCFVLISYETPKVYWYSAP